MPENTTTTTNKWTSKEPEHLYSIQELIAWLENPQQHWTGQRPLLYAQGARRQLIRIRRLLVLLYLAGFLAGYAICWWLS